MEFPLLIKKKKQSYIIQYILNRIRKNKNFLGLIVGGTGSGKSYSSLRIAELLDPGFTVKRVVFTAKEFMEVLESGTLYKGAVIIFDEAGVGIPAREWYNVMNKSMNYVLQTFRNLNIIVLFTTPDLSFIDSQSRKVLHGYFQTETINHTEKQVIIKPYFIQNDPKGGKTYYKFLPVIHKGESFTIDRMRVSLPSKEIINEYENKKREYTKKLNTGVKEGIHNIGKKTQHKNLRNCLICGHKWISRTEFPPAKCASCGSRDWNKTKKKT